MQWQNIKKYLYDLDYIASDELAMSIHIASSLGRPLLLEGDRPPPPQPRLTGWRCLLPHARGAVGEAVFPPPLGAGPQPGRGTRPSACDGSLPSQ